METEMVRSPDGFRLLQNYPNPFNPETLISYQLPAGDQVELSVYNLLGEKVSTLVSARKPAGKHEVRWDASGFATGIYYYTLTTSTGTISRKMVYIK